MLPPFAKHALRPVATPKAAADAGASLPSWLDTARTAQAVAVMDEIVQALQQVDSLDDDRVLRLLLAELPLKTAVKLAAEITGAQAIHPGYGFLSENAAFAEACEAAGLAFVGPTPQQLRVFGLKHTARALAKAEGVPLLEGSELLADSDEACRAAEAVGYPVMLKSTAGGGGTMGLGLAWETIFSIAARACPSSAAAIFHS